MYLENIVFDAVAPAQLGRFWAAALGAVELTDEPGLYECRLTIPSGPALDLCFQRVPSAPREPQRLHPDLLGGAARQEIVERLQGLGARPVDIGQSDVPWTVLADPEGNPFCVMEEREAYRDTGPIAALPLDSADPGRDAGFWAAITGWVDVPGAGAPRSLRHPSLRGPLLEICPEPAAKGPVTKNRMHLDVRLEADEDMDAAAVRIGALGGTEVDPGWGELPWRVFVDPSGNELCVLPQAAG